MVDVTIRISEVIKSGICVTSEDGQKVYGVLYKEIGNGNRVALSFSGVTRMTTAFLNAAVGQLYGELPEAEVRRHMLPPVDSESWHLVRLKMVIDRAKQYFSDKDRYSTILSEAIGAEKNEYH